MNESSIEIHKAQKDLYLMKGLRSRSLLNCFHSTFVHCDVIDELSRIGGRTLSCEL